MQIEQQEQSQVTSWKDDVENQGKLYVDSPTFKLYGFEFNHRYYNVTVDYRFINTILNNGYLESSHFSFYTTMFRDIYKNQTKLIAASVHFFADFLPELGGKLNYPPAPTKTIAFTMNWSKPAQQSFQQPYVPQISESVYQTNIDEVQVAPQTQQNQNQEHQIQQEEINQTDQLDQAQSLQQQQIDNQTNDVQPEEGNLIKQKQDLQSQELQQQRQQMEIEVEQKQEENITENENLIKTQVASKISQSVVNNTTTENQSNKINEEKQVQQGKQIEFQEEQVQSQVITAQNPELPTVSQINLQEKQSNIHMPQIETIIGHQDPQNVLQTVDQTFNSIDIPQILQTNTQTQNQNNNSQINQSSISEPSLIITDAKELQKQLEKISVVNQSIETVDNKEEQQISQSLQQTNEDDGIPKVQFYLHPQTENTTNLNIVPDPVPVQNPTQVTDPIQGTDPNPVSNPIPVTDPIPVADPIPVPVEPPKKKWAFEIVNVTVQSQSQKPSSTSQLKQLFDELACQNDMNVEDLKQLDYLYFPINQNQSHWISVVISFKKQIVYYFDSYYTNIDTNIRKGINQILEHLGLQPYQYKWIENYMRQDNGYDCGIFSLLSLLYTYQEKKYDYNQRTASQYRSRILYDLAIVGSQGGLSRELFEKIIKN